LKILFWYFIGDTEENHKNPGMGMLIFASDFRHYFTWTVPYVHKNTVVQASFTF